MGARKGGGALVGAHPLPPSKKVISVGGLFLLWGAFFGLTPPPYKNFYGAHITVNNSKKVTGCWVKFQGSNHASSVNVSSSGYTHKTT